jgi:hypothetical protein
VSLGFFKGAYDGVSAILEGLDTNATEGTVTALESRVEEDGVYYLPVVEYEVEAKQFRCKGKVASRPAMYEVGQKVRVRYKVDQPDVGVIDSFLERWLSPLVFGGVGGLFLVLMIWALLSRRNAQESAGVKGRS